MTAPLPSALSALLKRTKPSSVLQLKRSSSTRPKDLPYKFITAAHFIGSPSYYSEEHPVDGQNEKELEGYARWVQQTKRKWASDYYQRYPSEKTTEYKKLTHSGQDWWLVHERNRGNFETFVGVADGVGGWLEEGVDPAEVSQGLMFHADQYLQNGDNNQKEETSNSILTEAFERMLKDGQVRGGASTALIAKLDPTVGDLQWSNLGDSTLALVRQGCIQFRTKSQAHFFNCPFQLTKYPEDFYGRHDTADDTPRSADSGTFSDLQDGDLILLYTDGLGDNLWEADIVDIIDRTPQKLLPDFDFAHTLARTLSKHARAYSLSNTRLSPFAHEARRAGRNDLNGGKVDDVTLTVSLVRRNNTLES